MTEDEALGPGNISYIASTVADGTATPDEARRLLVEFVRQANTGNVEAQIIEHVRDCFAAFLVGKRKLLPARADVVVADLPAVKVQTLDKAFGIVRSAAGQPKTDDDTLAEVAMMVLEARLAGESPEDALRSVAVNRKAEARAVTDERQVRAAWDAHPHRLMGYVWLKVKRHIEGCGWTEAEKSRLCEMYAGVEGFKAPEKNSDNTSRDLA